MPLATVSRGAGVCRACNLVVMQTLQQLAAVTRQLREHDALLKLRDELVTRARAEGATWAQIAQAADMTMQGAQNLGQRIARRRK